MKTFDYKKIQSYLNRNETRMDACQELITYTESSYLKYWMTNIQFDYITFIESNIIYRDETVGKLIKYIMSIMQDTDKLFNPSNKSIQYKLNRLKNYKLELKKRVKVLTAYSDLAKNCEYILNRMEGIFVDSYHDIETDEDFSKSVLQFIFDEQDSVIINDKIKQIYAQLPIRMTKNRYYNILDQALDRVKGITKSDLEQYVSAIKEIFSPESVLDFGAYHMEIKEKLDQLKNIQKNEASKEAYLNSVELLQKTVIEIQTAMDGYLLITNLINELMGLLMVMNEESLKNNEAYITNFNLLMNLLNLSHGDDAGTEEEINALLEQTEGVIEDLVNDLGQCEVLVDSVIQMYSEDLINNQLINRFNAIQMNSILTSGSYFGELDEKGSRDLTLVDALYFSYAKKSLIEFVDNLYKQETKTLIRARIANSFTVLNVIHTKPQEIFEFILEAMSACTDKSEKMMSKRVIRQLMQELC